MYTALKCTAERRKVETSYTCGANYELKGNAQNIAYFSALVIAELIANCALIVCVAMNAYSMIRLVNLNTHTHRIHVFTIVKLKNSV